MSRGNAASRDVAPSDETDLPDVLRELRKQCGLDTTYSRLWRGIVEGRVPAVRVGKRYRVSRANYPAVVEALGLTPLRAA